MAVTYSRLGRVLPGSTPRTGSRNDDAESRRLTSLFDKYMLPSVAQTMTGGGLYEPGGGYPGPQGQAAPGSVRGAQPALGFQGSLGSTGGDASADDFIIEGINFSGGLGSGGGGGGGGGSNVPSSYYKALADAATSNAATTAGRLALEEQKAALSKEQAAALLARQQQGAAAQKTYLEGLLSTDVPKSILDLILQQEIGGKEAISAQAANLLADINARKETAETLSRTGYSNLLNYLAKNQPTAFAQAQRAMPTVTQSQLGQYMAGQGVSPAAAAEAARLANIQSAGGASNYNQLLNVLGAREKAAQGSREFEAESALNTQLAALQALYGRATTGLEQQRLGAEAQVLAAANAARLQAQRELEARNQAIRNALAQLLGTGLVGDGKGNGKGNGNGNGNGNSNGNGTDGNGNGNGNGNGTDGNGMTPEQTATANLAAAGMSPATISTILSQNIGNPLVPGGIPDYLRVIQEQTATPAAVSQAQAQAAQAFLNMMAPVEVNAPRPLIELNPIPLPELLALIGQAQNAPGYGEPYRPSTFDPRAYGNEMAMY